MSSRHEKKGEELKRPPEDSPAMQSLEAVQHENEELRLQLTEAQETIDAIRSGAVDALVVEEPTGHRIYTLEGADRPYRLFVEEMEQGAATLHTDGTIAWCNRQLGRLLKISQDKLIGALLRDFISLESIQTYDNLLWQGQTRSGRGEAQLKRADSARVPVFLTFNALPADCGSAIGVLITDLTPQRHHEQLTAAHAALWESQRQLTLVADTAPVYIAHCDTETRFKFVNEPYAQRFGLKPKDCVGKRLAEVVGTTAAENLRKHVETVLGGRAVKFEVELCYPTLGKHFMHCSYVPEMNAQGKVTGFVAAIIDITERKRAEEQLRHNHDTFFSLIENAPFGLYVVDSRFRLRQVSQASQKVFSHVRPLIGRDFGEVIQSVWAEPFASEVIARFRHTLETGEPYEAPNTTKQRGDIAAVESYDWKIERITLPDGQFGVVCYFYDITERKKSEEALQAAQAQLQEHAQQLETRVSERTSELRAINQQLETFVYSVAHDLRAPLRSMQGHSEMLMEHAGPALDETGRDLARRISGSALFMDALLLDLLSFSQTAQQQIDLKPVNLEAVIGSVFSQLEKEIDEKKARVEITGPWPLVLGHEATLLQVLVNLVNNALKFVAPGVSPMIRLRAQEWAAVTPASADGREGGAWVRVWVEDNGIGIAPHHQEQIFRLFVRLNGKAYGGTGVGLAIVHKGVERMGGKCGLESGPGKGSRFWIDLRRWD